MTTATATIYLYDILVEQGIEKERAQRAVDAFVTRAEAERDLATKLDVSNAVSDLRVEIKASENRLIIWMVGLQVAMAALLIAARLIG